MDLALDDQMVSSVFAMLPAGASLLSVAAVSRRFLSLARADFLWLKSGDERWRFGLTAAASASAAREPIPPLPLQAPGARDAAAELARLEASLEPLRKRIDAFFFFLNRCRKDAEILSLLAQLVVLRRGKSGSNRDPLVGALVRLEGLQSASQLNGKFGIGLDVAKACQDKQNERFSVIVHPSLQLISLKRQNIIQLAPMSETMASADEVEAKLLSVGFQAIDVLVQLTERSKQKPLAHPGLERIAVRTLAMLMERWAVQQWEQLLQDGSRCNLLEEGGLVLSQWAEPGVADVAKIRATLNELAQAVTTKLPTANASIDDRIQAVCAVLFNDYGFQGNTQDYYNPLNSCLHSVLEHRKGIPISLSVVWVAVATRAGVPCYICAGMPQHIIIRVTTGHLPQHDTYINAFGGTCMTFEELQAFTQELGFGLREEYVARRPATAVYSRMLRNLINIYQGQGIATPPQLDRLAGVVSQSIAISDPEAASEVVQLRTLRETLRLPKHLGW